jgi:hypothetical protein
LRRYRLVHRRCAAARQRKRESDPQDQLPFPKSTVGAFSAPAFAWKGVIGFDP